MSRYERLAGVGVSVADFCLWGVGDHQEIVGLGVFWIFEVYDLVVVADYCILGHQAGVINDMQILLCRYNYAFFLLSPSKDLHYTIFSSIFDISYFLRSNFPWHQLAILPTKEHTLSNPSNTLKIHICVETLHQIERFHLIQSDLLIEDSDHYFTITRKTESVASIDCI